LILFVSLLVCFPQTFNKFLLFSFQRPGVASSVTVVTGEYFLLFPVAVFLATRGESNGDGPYSQGFFSGFFQKKFNPLQLAVFKRKIHPPNDACQHGQSPYLTAQLSPLRYQFLAIQFQSNLSKCSADTPLE
jgi:hypothetical protein